MQYRRLFRFRIRNLYPTNGTKEVTTKKEIRFYAQDALKRGFSGARP